MLILNQLYCLLSFYSIFMEDFAKIFNILLFCFVLFCFALLCFALLFKCVSNRPPLLQASHPILSFLDNCSLAHGRCDPGQTWVTLRKGRTVSGLTYYSGAQCC